MELSFHGANCIKVSTKNTTLVIDDNLAAIGGKSITKSDVIALQTAPHVAIDKNARMIIDGPGEYEVGEISIVGVGARAHMDEENTLNATMYKIIVGEVSVAFIGHVFDGVSEDEIEELGHVDVLFVPVGNNGYTLDATGAMKIVKQIEPKIIIPTHYADKNLNFEVTQDDLAKAITGMGMEPAETVEKLKLKSIDIPANQKLVVLESK